MRLGRWFRRRVDDGIGEEMRTHIAQRAADIAASGVPLDAALRQARQEFGVLASYEQQCRREQRLGAASAFATGVTRDFVYGWRRLRATPLFTIFAVVSLAVGVGVTTAVYSIVQSVFWKPSGIPDGKRVALVAGSISGYGSSTAWRSLMSRADFDHLAASQTSFTSLAATRYFYQALVTDDASETLQGEAVTGSYFQTLGVQAVAGRTLDGNDDTTRAAVAVISHRVWRTQFAQDARIIGRVVRLGGHPFEIVGVASAPFEGTIMQMPRLTGIWIPLDSLSLLPHSASTPARPAQLRELSAIGRLPDERSAARASAEIAAIARQLDSTSPITVRTADSTAEPRARGWYVTTADAAYAELMSHVRGFGVIVMILIGMVLLVACTNLANLMLARGLRRGHDQSVRLALGASRWRLIREQCAESGIIAAAGAVLACVLTKLLLSSFSELPMGAGFSAPIESNLSLAAASVSIAAALAALAVFGIGPAIQLTRRHVHGALAERAGSVSARHKGTQRRAIRWQVAISSSFFIVSTLAMRAVMTEVRHDSGIDLHRIAVAHIDFYLQRWDEARARRTIDAVLEQGRRQPQLESIAISSGLPYGTTMTPYALYRRPGDSFKRANGPDAITIAASPGVFRTLGIELLQGRLFDERDQAGGELVLVMSASAAREIFGTADAVGRDVQMQSPGWFMSPGATPPIETARVIGIVGDADTTHLMRRSGGHVYRPIAQHYEPVLTIVGRAKGDPRQAVDAIRAAVRMAEPELSINRAGTGFVMLAGFYLTARIAAWTSISLGLLALLLSMVGLHGVLAQTVAMRTREVGLRIALGADRRDISRMVLSDGFRPVLQGLAIGLFLGMLGRFVVRATIAPTVGIFDPFALVVIPIPVFIAGFLACYIPARRAASVDPNVALRAL